jgi:hypothetical protein
MFTTYQGATLPRGGFPANSVNMRYVLSNTSFCCSSVISTGFSWLYPCRPISCPASRTAAISSGNVSRLCPGMNHVVLMSYFANSFKRRCVPIVPAKRPRLMSLVLSSPPYEPSHPATASENSYRRHNMRAQEPATASTSTPYEIRTRLLPIV